MKLRKPTTSFAPPEVRRFILPITLTTFALMVGVILDNLLIESSLNIGLIVFCSSLITGTLLNDAVITRTADFRESYGWLNAILTAIGLGLLLYVLQGRLHEISHIMIILGVIAVAILSGRLYGYATLLGIFVMSLPYLSDVIERSMNILWFGTPYIISVAAMEAILRIKDTIQQHLHHLEMINKASRQITLSLAREQTISLLNTTHSRCAGSGYIFRRCC
jgi:hypothetical protein